MVVIRKKKEAIKQLGRPIGSKNKGRRGTSGYINRWIKKVYKVYSVSILIKDGDEMKFNILFKLYFLEQHVYKNNLSFISKDLNNYHLT